MYTAAILTVSDLGSQGLRQDETGNHLKKILLKHNFDILYYNIIPDDFDKIQDELIKLCDELKVNLILTNGGTGFSKRDITPEATIGVVERQIPGFCEAMRAKSFLMTPRAILSRSICGIRNESIIINLPGSPKAALENFETIVDSIPHGIDILIGNSKNCADLVC